MIAECRTREPSVYDGLEYWIRHSLDAFLATARAMVDAELLADARAGLLAPDDQERFEERSAINEFDYGLSREQAEVAALKRGAWRVIK